MYRTIVVAVDGSESSNKALDAATTLAAQCRAAMHLVFVRHHGAVVFAPYELAAFPVEEELGRQAEVILAEQVSKVQEAQCISAENLHSHLVTGDPGRSVVEVANEVQADLIILGSKGHSDIAGLLLGSVSHKICNLAACSCLVVR